MSKTAKMTAAKLTAEKITGLTTVVLAFAGALALTGCEEQGPAEQLGESVDESAEEVGEAIEEAGEEVQESNQ